MLLVVYIWLFCIEESDARRPKWLGRRRRENEVKPNAMSSSSQETCEIATNPFDSLEYPSSRQQQQQQKPSRDFFNEWIGKYYDVPNSVSVFAGRLKAILMHEPPVGFVAVLVTIRLLWTGRIFTVYPNKYKSVDGVLTSEEKKTRRRSHVKIPLDTDDNDYNKFGGVERIRRQLCWSALNGVLQQGNASPQVVAAVDALSVSFKPRETRVAFCEEMIEPLATLEKVLIEDDSKIQSSVELRDMWEKPESDMDVVLQLAAKTAEIRALDALLRVSRDQLLTTSSRLFRNLKHWKRRVTIDNNLSWLFDKLMKASIEGDRMRLAYAKASFESEVSRLGSITQVLIARPPDMSDQALLDTLAKSSKEDQAASANGKSTKARKRKTWGPDLLARAIPRVSKYSLRFNAEGKGRLTLRVYDGETTIRSDVAWNELLHNEQVDPREWIEQAHDWTEMARRVLCDVLREAVNTSISDNEDAKRDLDVIDKWCTYDCGNCDDLEKQWNAICESLVVWFVIILQN